MKNIRKISRKEFHIIKNAKIAYIIMTNGTTWVTEEVEDYSINDLIPYAEDIADGEDPQFFSINFKQIFNAEC